MTIDPRATRRGGRLPLVIVLASSLVAASLLRQFVISAGASAPAAQRLPTTTGPAANVAPTEATFAATHEDFGQFNSYTLGLLLGGLRGPLVMTLWSTSETQKSDRNLDDINTKIELIRLLQPEFDSVHLFQIWNKAYNLSVQMANLPSKYAMILDALDYARNARVDRPDNINIESAIGGIYFDKLGTSAEKVYYRERLRDETMNPQPQVKITFPPARRDEFIADALAAGADGRRYTIRPEAGADLAARLREDYARRTLAKFAGPDVKTETFPPRRVGGSGGSRATMRTAADVVLDADGRILPSLAVRDRPADVNDIEWRPQDGELAYLTRFEPYPYGVSPFALAYNYFKRAVALQESRNQKQAQLSERVISSRPALTLKNWADEEVERGRRAEIAQYGIPLRANDDSDAPLEVPTAGIKPGPIAATPLLEEAAYCYDRASQIAARSVDEYRAHLKRYPEDIATYRNHIADVRGQTEYAAGDAAYARLVITADPAVRATLAREAAQHYVQAIDLFARNGLAFYVPDDIAAATFPKGFGKADVLNSLDTPASFPADQLLPTLARVRDIASKVGPISEIEQYQAYIDHSEIRLGLLKAATTQA